MENPYQCSATHFRPNYIPLMRRQMGCTVASQFQKKMLLWGYSRQASLSNISLQNKDSTQGNPSENWVLLGDMTTSGALDPACSRYLLTGRMNGSLVVHDTHSTNSEQVAGITRTVFPLVGSSDRINNTAKANAGVRCVQWYPHDNGMFCSSLADQIKIWDTENMCEVLNFSFEKTEVKHFGITPIGTLVAVASSTGEIHLCDLRSGASCHKLSRYLVSSSFHPANCVAWHPTQTNLLAAGYGDGAVLYWDVRSARKLPLGLCWTAPDESVRGMEFSSNGRRLVTHSSEAIHTCDPFIISSVVTRLAFNPEGGFGRNDRLQAMSVGEDTDLVFACFGCEVIMHDLSRDRPVQQLRAHLGPVNGCVLDSRLQRAFTFARDGNLITWQFGGAPTDTREWSAHSYCRKAVSGDMVFELVNSNQFSHYVPACCSYGNYPEVTLLPVRCYSCTLSGDEVKPSTQQSNSSKNNENVVVMKSATFELNYGSNMKMKVSRSSLKSAKFDKKKSDISKRSSSKTSKDSSNVNKSIHFSNPTSTISKSSSSSREHSRKGSTTSSNTLISGSSGNSRRRDVNEKRDGTKNYSNKEKISSSTNPKQNSGGGSSSSRYDIRKDSSGSSRSDGNRKGSNVNSNKEEKERNSSGSSNRVEISQRSSGSSSIRKETTFKRDCTNPVNSINYKDKTDCHENRNYCSSQKRSLGSNRRKECGSRSNDDSSSSNMCKTSDRLSSSSAIRHKLSIGDTENVSLSTAVIPGTSDSNEVNNRRVCSNVVSVANAVNLFPKTKSSRNNSDCIPSSNQLLARSATMRMVASEEGMPDEWSSDDD